MPSYFFITENERNDTPGNQSREITIGSFQERTCQEETDRFDAVYDHDPGYFRRLRQHRSLPGRLPRTAGQRNFQKKRPPERVVFFVVKCELSAASAAHTARSASAAHGTAAARSASAAKTAGGTSAAAKSAGPGGPGRRPAGGPEGRARGPHSGGGPVGCARPHSGRGSVRCAGGPIAAGGRGLVVHRPARPLFADIAGGDHGDDDDHKNQHHQHARARACRILTVISVSNQRSVVKISAGQQGLDAVGKGENGAFVIPGRKSGSRYRSISRSKLASSTSAKDAL